MFVWTVQILIEPLIHLSTAYLVYTILYNKDITFLNKIIIYSIYLPLIFLAPTKYLLESFNVNNCLSQETIYSYYSYVTELIYTIWLILICIKKYFTEHNKTIRSKIVYLLAGSLILLILFSWGAIIGSFTEKWQIAQYGLFGMPIFITILFYSIARFNLFKLKLIGRNIIVIILLVLIGSLMTITDHNASQIVTIITFIISLFLGIILIKSTEKEVVQLEKIELLASNLNSLNSTLSENLTEQTAEIKHTYELEKKARRDLEKLNETKDQFIRIAQHNLRIPITNIKNKVDFVLSGKFGKTDSELRKTLSESEESVEHLKLIADDFLNISKMKVGDSILRPSFTNILPLLESVLSELKIESENMNLIISYPTDKNSWPEILIDSNKIREVLTVIIENAIRYNVKNGKIKIETKKENDLFKIHIENTGVGITSEENSNLFNRSFYRSKRAKEINPTGMGIGLSVSRSIIEAHHGSLSVYSEGEGVGAMVVLSLPIDFLNRIR